MLKPLLPQSPLHTAPSASPFDLEAYTRERDKAAYMQISRNMSRKPGLAIESGGGPHAWLRGSYNPHAAVRGGRRRTQGGSR